MSPPGDSGATPNAQRLQRALGSQFEVVRLVGRGGFAEVYEVADTELRRRLAVKVLRTDIAWAEGMQARFKQEARALAQLSHAHTVPVHFVGEGEGLVFYVMPFIEGITLADVLRADGPLDLALAVGVAAPILDALEHAHRHGIVHRDLKPDNILIDGASGRPLLVDFGISKVLDDDGTPDGTIFGTPLYMSPEQALGERDVDGRADVYAMGVVLFQMLLGRPPFEGRSSGEIVAQHLADEVRFPAVTNGRLPDWMRAVITRALAKRREDRYASAAAMLEALRLGLPTVAVPMVTGASALAPINREDPTVRLDSGAFRKLVRDRRGPDRRRRPRRGLLLAALFAVVAGGAAIASLRSAPEPALVVENALLAPVALRVDGGGVRQIAPGDSARLPVTRGAAVTARWDMIAPRGADGALLGASLGATISVPEVRGEIRRRLSLATVGGGYLVPRVTNSTGDTLRVSLIDSAGAVLDCDCTVPPGAANLSLGYLPAGSLSRISIRDGANRIVTFESLLARSDRVSGAVDLSLRAADFVPPTALANRVQRPVAASTVVTPLPELRMDAVPLPAADSVADSADTQPRAPTRPADRDELGPIFRTR